MSPDDEWKKDYSEYDDYEEHDHIQYVEDIISDDSVNGVNEFGSKMSNIVAEDVTHMAFVGGVNKCSGSHEVHFIGGCMCGIVSHVEDPHMLPLCYINNLKKDGISYTYTLKEISSKRSVYVYVPQI